MAESQKVLVVDDEKLVCESCTSILGEEGFAVEATMSARDGLRRLDQERFDLLLADLRMPDMDGIELLENVRVKAPDLPVVVITGYPSVDTAVRTTQLGALEYIAKPFTPDELATGVRSALAKYEQAQALRAERAPERVISSATVAAAIDSAAGAEEPLAPAAAPRAGVITVDLNKCMACLTCVVECGLAHLSESNPNRHSPVEMMRNARVQVEAVGSHCVPMRCNQCEDAPCVKACPSGALTKLGPNQPVVIDDERCIGCKSCLLACPFGCIYVSGESNMVVKCDLCIGIVGPDEQPICVQSCPAEALKFVPVEDAGADSRKKMARDLVAAATATPEPMA